VRDALRERLLAHPRHGWSLDELLGELHDAEVPGCLVQGSTQLVEATTGFSITDHWLVFSGLCPTCKPA
jgi:hypothetical protein